MARFDAVGVFWEDTPAKLGRGRVAREMPPIPDTGWIPPTEYPNLAGASAIALDCETYDPDLIEKGPGWARGVGHIVGVSLGLPTGESWYFPIRHEVEAGHNLDSEITLAWLKQVLETPNITKIGANLLYDIGWLRQEGIKVAGQLFDVQFAEALLDEASTVALDNLGLKYLNEGKATSLLYQWCSDYYGGPVTGKQRENIYRAPPRLVGPYAEGDANLPIRIASKQYPLLIKEGLYELFNIECDLIYLLVEMRLEGVRVNINEAEKLRDLLLEEETQERKKLKHLVGFDVQINAAASLARAFDTAGLQYPKTAKGAPSFTKDYLAGLNHPIADSINQIRKLFKLRGTFVESYILDAHINGRIFGQFHPLRGDATGTRSGRFSSSDPNLQNLPAREDKFAPLVRGLFIPDEGHNCWRKYDYSQIEYRFLIHFAIGPGAEEARQHFNAHPETDYHDMTLDLVAPWAGWDISTPELRKPKRRPIKNINFGLIFGMGVAKLSYDLGLTPAEGKTLFAAYHKGVPFARPTMDECSAIAQQSGVITTILGRKSRFDLWEPVGGKGDAIPLPYHKAIYTYSNMQRAMTHKALNRRLQGSAADLLKMAMWKCWKDGVFDETGVPRLTVHDELDFSDPGGKDSAFAEMKNILETAIRLKIPVKADYESGPDWGHVK